MAFISFHSKFSGRDISFQVQTGSHPSARRVTKAFYDQWEQEGKPTLEFHGTRTGKRTLVKRGDRYYTREVYEG